jgi:DNA-cytosine methyltransferase
MIKFFSLFTGAGGVDCAARDLGLNLVGGLEKEDYPVQLYKWNFGPDIFHQDILDTGPDELPDFNFLWASPSCRHFSNSQRTPGETVEDIAIAFKIAEIIRVKQPDYFVLENVPRYVQDSKCKFTISFQSITNKLCSSGYAWDGQIVNAYDFGSTQDRKRLILRAVRRGIPSSKLRPTCALKNGVPFTCWRDRIISTETTDFTANQEYALYRKGIDYNYAPSDLIVQRTGYGNNGPIIRAIDQPLWTLRASHSCDELKGFRSSATYYNAETEQAYKLNDDDLASLMGFPSDYKWGPSKGANSYAACNAVPIEFASAVIRSMTEG